MFHVRKIETYSTEIEAVFFDGQRLTIEGIKRWLQSRITDSFSPDIDEIISTKSIMILPTVEGPKVANHGDFIVLNQGNELSIMSAADFNHFLSNANTHPVLRQENRQNLV